MSFPVDTDQIAFVPGRGLVHVSELSPSQRALHAALLNVHSAAWTLSSYTRSKFPTDEAETAYLDAAIKARQLAEAQGVSLIWSGQPEIPDYSLKHAEQEEFVSLSEMTQDLGASYSFDEVNSTIKIKTSDEIDSQAIVFVGPAPEYRLNFEGKIVSIKLFGQVIYLPRPLSIDTAVFEDEEAVVIDFSDFIEFDDIEDWGKSP